MVATARIAVDGFGAAVHTGIGGGHGLGNDIVDDVAAGVAEQYFAGGKAMAFHSFVGGGNVVGNGVQDEFKLFDGRFGGKLIDLAGTEFGRTVLGLLVVGCQRPVEQHLTVLFDMHKVRMLLGNGGDGLMPLSLAETFHVKLLGCVLERNGDVARVLVEPLFRGLHLFFFQVEHFQLTFTLAGDKAHGYGDRQAYHARAGDAHAHGVFEDIAA